VRVRLGDFVLDQQMGTLTGPEGELHLRPQTFRLLLVLVEEAPRILSSDEILDRVWGTEHLSPSSLRQAVSELRQALGDTAAKPGFVETVHRRGYRFIAPLTPLPTAAKPRPAPDPPPAPTARAVETVEIPLPPPPRPPSRRARPAATTLLALLAGGLAGSLLFAGLMGWATGRRGARPPTAGDPPVRPAVAVLGFKNLTGDPELDWISGAVAEIVRFDLGAPGSLRLIPGEDVARMCRELALPEGGELAPETLRQIRGNLGADLVVTGSYLAASVTGEGALRLQASVQSTARGEILGWSREMGSREELMPLVGRLVTSLRSTLNAASPPPEGTAAGEASLATQVRLATSTESLRLYAEAQAAQRRFDAPRARLLLERAVEIDPDNPLHRDALAAAYQALGLDSLAVASARRAAELAASLPWEEGLSIQARSAELAGDWERAAGLLTELVRRYPDSPEHTLRLAQVQRAAGKAGEALATLDRLREVSPEARVDPRVLRTEAAVRVALNDLDLSRSLATEALARAEERGATLLAADACYDLYWVHLRQGDLEAARLAVERLEELARQGGDPARRALALAARGNLAARQGRTSEAREAYGEAIHSFRELGDRRREAATLNNFAAFLNGVGELEAIPDLLLRSVELKREAGHTPGLVTSLTNLANIYTQAGRIAEAREHLAEALALSREIDDRERAAFCLRGLGNLHRREGDFPAARASFEEALLLAEGMQDREGIAQAHYGLGALTRQRGEPAAARDHFTAALEIFEELGQIYDALDVRCRLGEVDLAAGAREVARRRFGAVLVDAEARGARLYMAQALAGLGEVAVAEEDREDARREFTAALALFEELGHQPGVEETRQRLEDLER